MVVDTSALLAVFFAEAHADWVARQLQRDPILRVSLVNFTEYLIVVGDRNPARVGLAHAILAHHRIDLHPPTRAEAELAAWSRLRFPLNLGDCFAYALAKSHDEPLLTLDRDFLKCDIRVVFPPLM